jgi:hypothetical protein
MSEWIVSGVPTFAVVGRVNMGKSAVLATLLEVVDDRVVRVSATPGETTRCQILPVAFGGAEMIRFIDTPGFSRPLEAMRAIENLHGEGTPDLSSVKRFVAEQMHGGEFEDEARLLEPIVAGAGVLYVVDPGKPMRDAFVAEMEILRWTGQPRMALLNDRGAGAEEIKEWKSRLGSYFNLVRTFDAHRARFEERKRLLGSLLEIDEEHREMLEAALESLKGEWEERRDESANVILDLLRECLVLRVETRLEEEDSRLEHRRAKKLKELAARYFKKIQNLERKSVEELLEIYRHHLVKVGGSQERYIGIDLLEGETWRKWGLNRGQLAVAGGFAGAASGAIVDVGTGGLTHGVPTILGGLVGAIATFWKGAHLPEIGLGGGLTVSKGSGKSLVLGPPRNDNFPWILLDSVLSHYREVLARAHGRRDVEVLARGEGEGFVRDLTRSRRALLAKWFESCAKGAPNRGLEPKVFEELRDLLSEIEG